MASSKCCPCHTDASSKNDICSKNDKISPPIVIKFIKAISVELTGLIWKDYDATPKTLSIDNTGSTIMISGKWPDKRPCITGGPLDGNYVFSQMHFHWPSEHEIRDVRYPLEMHVVHIKSKYLTHDRALQYRDGTLILVYLFEVTGSGNAGMAEIKKLIPSVKDADTKAAMPGLSLVDFFKPFENNYFLYWSALPSTDRNHIIQWIVSPTSMSASEEEVYELQSIHDKNGCTVQHNCGEARNIYMSPVHFVGAIPPEELLDRTPRNKCGGTYTQDMNNADKCRSRQKPRSSCCCEGCLVHASPKPFLKPRKSVEKCPRRNSCCCGSCCHCEFAPKPCCECQGETASRKRSDESEKPRQFKPDRQEIVVTEKTKEIQREERGSKHSFEKLIEEDKSKKTSFERSKEGEKTKQAPEKPMEEAKIKDLTAKPREASQTKVAEKSHSGDSLKSLKENPPNKQASILKNQSGNALLPSKESSKAVSISKESAGKSGTGTTTTITTSTDSEAQKKSSSCLIPFCCFEKKAEDQKSGDKKLTEKKSDEKKLTEKKSDEKKLTEKKSLEKKPRKSRRKRAEERQRRRERREQAMVLKLNKGGPNDSKTVGYVLFDTAFLGETSGRGRDKSHDRSSQDFPSSHPNFDTYRIEEMIMESEGPEVNGLNRQEDLDESIMSRRSTETGRSIDEEIFVSPMRLRNSKMVEESLEHYPILFHTSGPFRESHFEVEIGHYPSDHDHGRDKDSVRVFLPPRKKPKPSLVTTVDSSNQRRDSLKAQKTKNKANHPITTLQDDDEEEDDDDDDEGEDDDDNDSFDDEDDEDDEQTKEDPYLLWVREMKKRRKTH